MKVKYAERKELIMNQLVDIYKLMSDETRLRILVLLYQEECCVCELSDILDVPQPRISKNLSKLRDLNLVSVNRHDKFMYYTLKKEENLLIQSLDLIIKSIKDYPQLASDQERLFDKEQYLKNSTLACLLR